MGYAFENLMNVYSLVSAYAEWCTVNKADTRAFTQKDLLDEQSQGNSDFYFQFYKTVVLDNLGKQMAHMLTHLFKIEIVLAYKRSVPF